MEVAPRTRIFGAVPNVPDTFCTETPGRTALEAAADIAHTGKFHVIGHQLIGRTGKEALVRLGHTCHHDCFHCLSVGFEAHADVGGDGCFLGFITYIGNLQLPPPFRAGI